MIIDVFISHSLAQFLSRKMISSKNMMCSEFVYQILIDCGVLKSEYPKKLFWPFKISEDEFRELEKVRYSKPYRFSLT